MFCNKLVIAIKSAHISFAKAPLPREFVVQEETDNGLMGSESLLLTLWKTKPTWKTSQKIIFPPVLLLASQ